MPRPAGAQQACQGNPALQRPVCAAARQSVHSLGCLATMHSHATAWALAANACPGSRLPSSRHPPGFPPHNPRAIMLLYATTLPSTGASAPPAQRARQGPARAPVRAGRQPRARALPVHKVGGEPAGRKAVRAPERAGKLKRALDHLHARHGRTSQQAPQTCPSNRQSVLRVTPPSQLIRHTQADRPLLQMPHPRPSGAPRQNGRHRGTHSTRSPGAAAPRQRPDSS